jgi:carnitine 3-dehydrogenase
MSREAYPKIGIVSTGVIGASWAAYYLSRGYDVSATEPAPEAESKLRSLVESLWERLGRIGLAEGASVDRLSFDGNLGKALAGVDFVQENGPERLDIKRELFAEISAAVGENVIIATSSSGILISGIQDPASNPGVSSLATPSTRRT